MRCWVILCITACSSVLLGVQYTLGGVQVTPARPLVETGQTVILTCTTKDAGPMNVYMFQWRHMPTNTLLTATLHSDMASVLTVSNVTTIDQGMYLCTASNEGGNHSATAVVVVSPKGNTVVSPMYLTVNSGDTATFNCSAEGGPDTLFHWLYATERLNCSLNCSSLPADATTAIINSTTNLAVSNTSVLSISSVNATQNGGTYECVAINVAGFAVTRSMLFVSPVIVEHPQDQLAKINITISLTCHAESFPFPRYQWQKYNTTMETYQIMPSTEETFRFVVSYRSFGDYRCMVTTPLINEIIYSNASAVTVSPFGSVCVSPGTLSAMPRDVANFTCMAEGGPGNTFQWKDTRGGSVVSNDPLLSLTSTAMVGGIYQCCVSNAAGNDTSTVALNVGPEIVLDPASINVTSIENITLTCSATGFPVPTITWQHNGTTIVAMGHMEINSISSYYQVNSTLNVRMAMTNDTGNYSCTATSSIAVYSPVSSQVILVLVQDIPEQPHSLMTKNVTSRNLTLTWVEPHDNNAAITGYRVFYTRPIFLGGDNVTINVTGSIEEVFIGDLHPGVTYSFTVDAFNDIGVSVVSEPIVQKANEETPSPPTMIKATARSMSVVIEWDEVPIEEHNGVIRGYTVGGYIQQFRTDLALNDTIDRRRRFAPTIDISDELRECLMSSNRSEAFRATINNATQHFMTFYNLVPYAEYNFTVDAFTNAGHGDPAPTQRFRTTVTNPEVVEEIYTVSDSTSLTVSWMPPDCHNGPISSYTIAGSIASFCCSNSREAAQVQMTTISSELQTCLSSSGRLEKLNSTVNDTQLSEVFTNLVPYAEYRFTITATTDVAGRGDTSAAQIITTNVDRADPVQSLTVTTLNSSSLLIQWAIPDCPNGPISGYGVYYRLTNNIQSGDIDSTGYFMQFVNETNFNGGSTRFAVIGSLMSLRNYTVHVRGLTDYNGTRLFGRAEVELIVMLTTEAVELPPLLVDELVNVSGMIRRSVIPMAFIVNTILPSIESIVNSVGNGSNVTFYAITRIMNPTMDEIDNLGEALADLERSCVIDDNVCKCISAGYGLGEIPPVEFPHGDGRITTVSRNAQSSHSRRQVQQAVNYTNTALTPETEYCLAVMVNVQSGVQGVSLKRHYPLACPVRTTRSYSLEGLIIGLILAFFLILCCIILLILLCCYYLQRRKRDKNYDAGTKCDHERDATEEHPVYPNPAYETEKPTYDELVCCTTKDGQELKIIPLIVSYGSICCDDLTHFLMDDDFFTERNFRRLYGQNDDKFMREVFKEWLNSGGKTTPTWNTLCDCVHKTPNLPETLVDKIRDNFCK